MIIRRFADYAAGLADADLPKNTMYAAKRDRSGYAIYTESFDAHLGGTLSLAADLQLAIERRQLYLEYQPVAELPNGEIKLVEALVRWRHPDRGVSRGRFTGWTGGYAGLHHS